MNYIVYTDLDGTLLDHDTYSFDAAKPAMKLLRAHQVPVIPVTSKTRAELEPLRAAIGLESPFIVENGSAVFIPPSYFRSENHPDLKTIDGYAVKAFSPDSHYWRTFVKSLAMKIPHAFEAFSDMSVERVVELTGLSDESASQASQREYSNPLYWFGSDQQFSELVDASKEEGVEVVRGGRFVHLLKGANKGQALSWLHDYLTADYTGGVVESIALGDGENDVVMLEAADIAVQIRSSVHEFPHVNRADVYQTQAFGPAGWSEAILDILNSNNKN